MRVSAGLLLCAALLRLHGGCAASRGWRLGTNDATETLPDYSTGNTGGSDGGHEAERSVNGTGSNRAQSGGRSTGPSISAAELSCREIRSTRLLTDGFCTSTKPVRELVCSGQCLPAHLMPNSIVRGKWWRGGASDYRCVPAHVRTRRIQLRCPNGNTRTYKTRLVTSCKCKRFRPHHNQSQAKEAPKAHRSRKHRTKSHTPLSGNSY
ncbi:sclerostin [Gouania willdenowi]|uniref:Sclerostin n=1 Tax=Gouania willdenowi TaxID=441366 RepID=A0A8C5HK11_GOUWI|nr:sclerostin [Gouania willdenowi]